MVLTKEKWWIVFVIALMAIIIFINLGSGEIQPWDEGLYAIRAKSILHFNDFLDQTAYSPGGLYSSTYPPLTIWFISGAMSIFGENQFSVRLFSALCSVAALIFIFLISRRVASFKFSLLAVILTGATLVWNKFSREGMTDIPLTFFFILTFWASIKLRESDDKKKIILFSAIFAVGFASALMTKIVISFLPLLFVFLTFVENNNKKWYLLVASIAAIALASPWYIYMISQHGAPFYKALLVPHIYSVVETNSPKLGVLYYLNQLLVSNSYILFTFVFLLMFISDNFRKKINELIESKYILYTVIMWFSIAFIVLSLSRTKMLHYAVYMVPPAIFIAIVFIENIREIIKNNKIISVLLICVVALIIWSFNPGLREDIKILFTDFSFTNASFIYFLFILVSIASVLFLYINLFDKWISKYMIPIVYFITTILLFNIIVLNGFYRLGHSYGAEKAAGFVLDSKENSFVYLYHEATAADSLNPQLAWYTKGIMNQWVKGKTYKPYTLPLNQKIVDVLNDMKSLKENIVIYYKPREKEFAEIVNKNVSKEWKITEYCDRYIVFRRKF
ncbi:MAG: hypothetical protein A2X61_15490 [Ignavibacteria bacterium GWB2_35_12]|nr:MAG: hypothetical protein A2X63_09665 [Ignavibacteria bacterium GWA2_35_8]OGU38814.1 MAG: hypothetical protein A2X61_15490 [Ignavibacteria bacterium GWB2_35_12]OGU88526.1 MAG: hypothetical protein A2220_06295 [Ignavibacteria bacterium RIFOXYA2_FULL_35_10]OGV20276.1 MAG: hypothetical protein A2475_12315 [Ignavibacteria bacterium RIFOXYC2_FULL_35_21]